MSQTCDKYPNLWNYDFQIQWDTDADYNYIRVPLASFAANYEEVGGVCVIFVEYLDSERNDGKQIIFGGMFFQSVYAKYTLAGFNY